MTTMNKRHNHRMKGYPFTRSVCIRHGNRREQAVWQCECGLNLCSNCVINLVSIDDGALAEVVVKRKANFLI